MADSRFNPAFVPFFEKKARFKFLFGGRGSGKSYGVGDILVAKSIQERLNILCARQIQASISDSVQSLLTERAESLGVANWFKATQAELVNKTGSRFMFKGLKDQTAQTSVKSIFNIHCCWVEEAQSVTQEALDFLTPSVRGKGSELIFTYNRLADNDPVHKLFLSLADSESQKVLETKNGVYRWVEYSGNNMIGVFINHDGNPFFPEELEFDRKHCLEKFPDDYGHIWLGEPLSKELNTIINRAQIAEAMSRKISGEGQAQVGCDVARYGDDKTVITTRKGLKVFPQKEYSKLSVPETARYCMEAASFDKSVLIKVDDSGVGGGVTDILQENGYNAIGVNNAQVAKEPDKYPNAISEMWFECRDLICQMELPGDTALKDELAGRRYGLDSKARRFVEKKDDYKKRYGKSPDRADSLLLCLYQPKGNAVFQKVNIKLWK